MQVQIDAPIVGRGVVAAAVTPRPHSLKGRALVAPPSRKLTLLAFVLSDLGAMTASVALSFAAAEMLWADLEQRALLITLPVAGVLGIVFTATGLYTNVAMHPAEEMRRVGVFATLAFLTYTSAYLGGYHDWSIVGLFVTLWLTSVVLIAGSRVFLRILCSRTTWWGYPVVVIGNGRMGASLIRTMKRWPELGFRPVVLLDETATVDVVEGVPVERDKSLAPQLARQGDIPCAVVAISDLPQDTRHAFVSRYAKFFDRLLVVSEASDTDFLWTTSIFFRGMLGYDVRYNYNKRWARLCKRTFDLVSASLGIVLLSPLWLALMVLIRFDSPGPIFFRQLRMGEKGRTFTVLKFRSMRVDAHAQLDELLEKDPIIRQEYEEYRKLRSDPRVTVIGRFLRRYSLDELPQLWNVVRGEMSLVGPRAYTLDELGVMNHMESVIIQNRPGLTGLWQVSGRNLLSFAERLKLDAHYTHNWNFWLDAYILARTIPVVLTGEGAS